MPERDADPSLPGSFVVRGGMLVSLGKPEGHLITKQAYRDYRLVAEYPFPGAGGNCGLGGVPQDRDRAAVAALRLDAQLYLDPEWLAP